MSRSRQLPDRQGRVQIRSSITIDTTGDSSVATSGAVQWAGFLDTWNLMCITKEIGEDRKLYINGSQIAWTFVNTGVGSSDWWFDDYFTTNDQNVTFGKVRPSSNSEYFDGWIANTGFAQEVITPAQMSTMFNATTNAEFETAISGFTCDHYWSLQEAALNVIDQGSFATLHDLTTSFGTPDFRQNGPHDTSDGSWYSIRFQKSSGGTGEYLGQGGFLDFTTNFSSETEGTYFCWFKTGPLIFFIGDNAPLPCVKDTSLSRPSEFLPRITKLQEGELT